MRCRPYERTPEQKNHAARLLCARKGFLHHMKLAFVEALCERITHQHMDPGQVIILQGEVGQSMYMVLSGSCNVIRHYNEEALSREPSLLGTCR